MKQSALLAILLAALAVSCSQKAAPAGDGAQQQAAGAIRNDNGGAPSQSGMQPQAARAPGPMKPLPPGVYAMQKAQVVDQAGFAQPMVAATLLVPYGWRTEGGIVWGAYQQCGPDYANNWAMTSPDGSASMRVLPGANWTRRAPTFRWNSSRRPPAKTPPTRRRANI